MAWNAVLAPTAVACWLLAGAGAPVSAMPPGVDRGAMPMGQRSADAHFIVMMIPHHEGAIAMAELALQRSRRAEIRGLAERIRASFNPDAMLPAAGQGALGIEVRSDRPDVVAALAPLAHARTWAAVTAERAVSRCMGGSCSMPLAAFATFEGDLLGLRAAVSAARS